MKRIGYLFDKICSIDNITLAYQNASFGKSHYKDVQDIKANPETYFNRIYELLSTKTYRTSKYVEKIIFDGNKERVIHKLPFFPDRIMHHALMQVVYSLLTNCLIRNTFQSIKGRGVQDCRERIRTYFKRERPTYFIKIDIQKFYPSVDKNILKQKLRTKIKCNDTLDLLDEIIDSSPKGLPIGNYTSQILGNFYLSSIDWRLCQTFDIGYFRYCDDILILLRDSSNAEVIINTIMQELKLLNLTVKYVKSGSLSNGITFAGYRHNKTVCRITKKVIYRVNTRLNKPLSLTAYKGFVLHINNAGVLASIKGKI